MYLALCTESAPGVSKGVNPKDWTRALQDYGPAETLPRLQPGNPPLRAQIPAPKDGSPAALPALQAHSTVWV